MNYEEASVIVKSNYAMQADMIMNGLCQQAIITLANLCKQNIRREMTNYTINNLSQMEPHRQVGFLANPFLEFVIGKCFDAPSQPEIVISAPTGGKKSTSKSQSKVEPKVEPRTKPEPEPIPDPEPEPDIPPDLFNLF
jgi:hypothetical protein